MKHAEYKKHACYGPGGRQCPCCSPSPGQRERADRTERRRLKRREQEGINAELHDLFSSGVIG